jgi:hypothetical protein
MGVKELFWTGYKLLAISILLKPMLRKEIRISNQLYDKLTFAE